jgi:hypothetical protein
MRILLAYGTQGITDAVAAAGRHTLPALVVGITREPKAKCWRVGLARTGSDLRWVSAHRHKKEAELQAALVYATAQDNDLADDVIFAALVGELEARRDAELWAACEAAGRRVLEQVRRHAEVDAQRQPG